MISDTQSLSILTAKITSKIDRIKQTKCKNHQNAAHVGKNLTATVCFCTVPYVRQVVKIMSAYLWVWGFQLIKFTSTIWQFFSCLHKCGANAWSKVKAMIQLHKQIDLLTRNESTKKIFGTFAVVWAVPWGFLALHVYSPASSACCIGIVSAQIPVSGLFSILALKPFITYMSSSIGKPKNRNWEHEQWNIDYKLPHNRRRTVEITMQKTQCLLTGNSGRVFHFLAIEPVVKDCQWPGIQVPDWLLLSPVDVWVLWRKAVRPDPQASRAVQVMV